jgi:Tol biopolymer transport system component
MPWAWLAHQSVSSIEGRFAPLETAAPRYLDIVRGSELIISSMPVDEMRRVHWIPRRTLVFGSGTQRINIWALPLNANTGNVTGAPYRVSYSLARQMHPVLSRDGRKLLFDSTRNGILQVWEREPRERQGSGVGRTQGRG